MVFMFGLGFVCCCKWIYFEPQKKWLIFLCYNFYLFIYALNYICVLHENELTTSVELNKL